MSVLGVRVQKQIDQKAEQSERLFVSLAEQLGEVYVQISHLSELALEQHDMQALRQIAVISGTAMKLTDGYVKSMRAGGEVELNLEPVSVNSLLHEAEKALRPFAREHNVQLEIADMPRLEPVLCDRSFMHSALVCLGQVFVVAESAHEEPMPVRLDAYRTRGGIVTGIYSKNTVMNSPALRKARKFFGQVEQPMSLLVAGAATGVFVADTLLGAMQTELHVARHRSHVGLGTTLQRCNQMQLV